MKNKCISLIAVFFIFTSIVAHAGPGTTTQFIKIDQFGYRTSDQKIAVISNPVTGFNSALTFNAATGANNYEVRDWITDAPVYSGTITSWNGGATHSQSGDKVWWFDFSSLTTVGSYYLFDVSNNVGSYRFEINDCVYNEAMKQAMRTYYYQRCGTVKTAACAGTNWSDGACHLGTNQDTDCKLYSSPTNSSTSKDLSGGWHDAGDYNKYVNFAWGAVCDLLLAYEENSLLWVDGGEMDLDIPETGNGIPDVLDEVKFELDWILKMQQTNGSVLCMVGSTNYSADQSPPSASTGASANRVYGPATTAATISAAGMFALAAIQFNSIGNTTYGTTLKNAAVSAWTWANANPNIEFQNAGIIVAGEQALGASNQRDSRFTAASAYLFALTGTATYKTYCDNNYANVYLIAYGNFANPFYQSEADALLYYSKTPGATAATVADINSNFSDGVKLNKLPDFDNNTDAYRAYMPDNYYVWNSNQPKAKMGNIFSLMNAYNFDTPNATKYKNAALGYLHFFHGVNPLSYTFLTNMGTFGAENSITTIYSEWFADGSVQWDETGISTYGPAPGFLPQGINPTASTTLSPPSGQPILKSYANFNQGSESAWEVTECAIYTQAAYIRMLARYCSPGSCSANLQVTAYCSDSVILNWTNSGSNWFVDVSPDPNFSFYYNKSVSNLSSTSAPYGFVCDSVYGLPCTPNTLSFQSNTTYYWRIWIAPGHMVGNSFIVPAPPAIPTLTQNGNMLTSSAVTGNQWYLNNNSINGASSQNYTPFQSGNYSITVTDTNGCSATSAAFNFTTTGIGFLSGSYGLQSLITLYPNPNNGTFTLYCGKPNTLLKIRILNLLDEQIQFDQITNNSNELSIKLQENQSGNVSPGIYFIQLFTDNNVYTHKIIIQ